MLDLHYVALRDSNLESSTPAICTQCFLALFLKWWFLFFKLQNRCNYFINGLYRSAYICFAELLNTSLLVSLAKCTICKDVVSEMTSLIHSSTTFVRNILFQVLCNIFEATLSSYRQYNSYRVIRTPPIWSQHPIQQAKTAAEEIGCIMILKRQSLPAWWQAKQSYGFL